MADPKVGVCVPCYKRLDFTKFCVPLAMQNAGIEATWYLVDDASEDGTFEFLSSIRQEGMKIVPIKNSENMGIAKTRNMIFRRMLEDGIEVFCNMDNDLLLPINWLLDLAWIVNDESRYHAIAPWFVNDKNITANIQKIIPLNQIGPDEVIEIPVGSTCIVYSREIFEEGIFYPDKKANWTYQDSQHHKIIKHKGYKIGMYTGVQAWRLELIIWNEMETEKLKVRHQVLNQGSLKGFEENLARKRKSVPF